MNIPSVPVWKAGNGIFIEYFWEYLWETLVITSIFVLLRHNFCFPKLHLSFCLSVCVLLSLCYFLFVSVFVSHCIYSIFLCAFLSFSLSGFSTTSKPELSQNLNLNLIPNALQ